MAGTNKYLAENNKRCAGIPVSSAAEFERVLKRHWGLKRVQFGYGLNYLIDTEHAVIVDVEATPARTFDEVAATRTMIDRTETAFGLRPQRLSADTAYGTGRLIA